VRITWQDAFTVASLLLSRGAVRSEDVTFLVLYTVAAAGCAVVGVWSHRELSRIVRMLAVLLILIAFGYLDVKEVQSINAKLLIEPTGYLVSAGLPSPLTTCPIPLDALVIYAGGNVSSTRTFPHTVFRVSGSDLVTIDKDKDGHLLVSAKIFDDRDNLIAKLEGNQYVSTSYASHFKRPDRSTLLIYDHEDRIALEVKLINDSAVRFTGRLHAPGNKLRAPLIVTDKSITVMRTILSGECFGGESHTTVSWSF
jgi:hypothetical protein